jgi:hypothetical protein
MLAALALVFCGFSGSCASDVQQELNDIRAQGNFPVGTIVKAEGRPELYMMVPVGKAAHIPTVQVLSCLGIQDRTPLVISRERLKALPKTPLLLKSPGGDIYKISGDRKRLITSPAAFEQQGFDPASVLPMTDAQLNCIKDGRPIN